MLLATHQDNLQFGICLRAQMDVICFPAMYIRIVSFLHFFCVTFVFGFCYAFVCSCIISVQLTA